MSKTRRDNQARLIGRGSIPFLARRRYRLLLCLLLAAVAALAVTLWHKSVYEAQACVEVVLEGPEFRVETAGADGGQALAGGAEGHFFRQCELARSHEVLGLAAQRLASKGVGGLGEPGRAADLGERVDITAVRGTSLVRITGKAAQATWAVAIANEVAEAFVEASAGYREARDARQEERLGEQLARCDTYLAGRREALETMLGEHVMAGQNAAQAHLDRRIAMIDERLTQVQLSRIALEATGQSGATDAGVLTLPIGDVVFSGEARSGQTGAAARDVTMLEALPAASGDEVASYERLQAQLACLRWDQARMEQDYLDGHPSLQAVREEIASLEKQVKAQRERALDQADRRRAARIAMVHRQEQALTELLGEQKALAVEMSADQQQYQTLVAEVRQAERLRGDCVARLAQMTLEREPAPCPVVMLERAEAPLRAAGLTKTQLAGLILLGGLVVGVVVGFGHKTSGGGWSGVMSPTVSGGNGAGVARPGKAVLWQVGLGSGDVEGTVQAEADREGVAAGQDSEAEHYATL